MAAALRRSANARRRGKHDGSSPGLWQLLVYKMGGLVPRESRQTCTSHRNLLTYKTSCGFFNPYFQFHSSVATFSLNNSATKSTLNLQHYHHHIIQNEVHSHRHRCCFLSHCCLRHSHPQARDRRRMSSPSPLPCIFSILITRLNQTIISNYGFNPS